MTRKYNRTKSTKPSKGSLNHYLSSFGFTDERYREVFNVKQARTLQARVQAHCRYPETMQDYRFETGLYTAICASDAADIRYLVRIKRIQ